ncbi:hypothetical protein BT69DRAFT_190570 [Atractiella rhizophila]|nr:hypothetical protein BT69DRAFT_190570 [Atractiella rhizophila]
MASDTPTPADRVPLSFPAFLLLRPPNSRTLRPAATTRTPEDPSGRPSVPNNLRQQKISPVGKRRLRRLENGVSFFDVKPAFG